MKSEIESKLFQVSLLISEISFKMSDENQQMKSKCLSAVGVILSQIESFVSIKLSRANTEVCDSSSSLNDGVYDSSSGLNDSVCDSYSSLNDDVCEGSSSELSWDNNNYSYYNLFFKDEAEDTTDDDREEAIIHDDAGGEAIIQDDNGGEAIINDDAGGEAIIDDDDGGDADEKKVTPWRKDKVIVHLVSFIEAAAPSYIYDVERMMAKRRRQKRRRVHPELRHVWTNAATILSPEDSSMNSTSLSYPTVDWKNVNRRFLSNIPTPVSIPIHGCSINPEHYKDDYVRSDFGGMQNIGSKFTREFPFGSKLGFLTDAGPVKVPDEVFHGYKYQPGQGWILHATFSEMKQVKKYPKMKKRRKK